MKVCVIGLGYIGLPTASIMANNGFDVVGIDVKEETIEGLKKGVVNIEEPGLSTLVNAALNANTLKVSKKCEKANAFMIAVPTPVKNEPPSAHVPKSADMSFVISAAESIVPCLEKGNLVVLESTSPPGTTKNLVCEILERSGLKAGVDFFLAYSPERVLPGAILKEMIANDRVVGGIDEKSTEKAADLYSKFVQGTIHKTDCTTAEMVKLSENTFRDVNIALANEMARICEEVGANVWEVVRMANHHPRVNLHQPGPGVGGHCIAVDPWFLVEVAPEDAQLIKKSREVNDAQPAHIVKYVESILDENKIDAVAFLGLTYKPDVDDVRESPAIEIVEAFRKNGRSLIVHDPHVKKWTNDEKVDLLEDVVSKAGCIVILVNHKEFQNLKKLNLTGKVLVDTRNTFRNSLPPDTCDYRLIGVGKTE